MRKILIAGILVAVILASIIGFKQVKVSNKQSEITVLMYKISDLDLEIRNLWKHLNVVNKDAKLEE